MTRLNKPKLQGLINEAARTSAAFFVAQAALNDECARIYGVEPGDVDCDSIIDAVLGGCGMASGMSVEDFDREMRASMKR